MKWPFALVGSFALVCCPSLARGGSCAAPVSEALEASVRCRNMASGALTPMTEGEARLHLALAYQAIIGGEPRPAVLSVMLAQWALETARGKKMFGYNFGGLTSLRRGIKLHTREFYGSRQVSGPRRFRVYETATAGAMDYVQTLAQAFPKSFDALHDGGAIAFVRALSEEDYFTGNPVHYRSAVVSLAREFDRKASIVP